MEFSMEQKTDNVSLPNRLGNLYLLILFVAVIVQIIKFHESEKYGEEGTLLSFSCCHSDALWSYKV